VSAVTPAKRVVLGIDAAWTASQPSGVALASETSGGWHLVAVEASYARFHARAAGALGGRPKGSRPRPSELLASSLKLSGRSVDLVAIDIPLSHAAIMGCRRADQEVARTYGAQGCEERSPSTSRPGRIGREMKKGFRMAGYSLLTRAAEPPGIIEVDPHLALIELTGADRRLQYKATKARWYWGRATPAQRYDLLLRWEWAGITALLEQEITGVEAALPLPDHRAKIGEQRAFEDNLDAVISAWVGVCALRGRAAPFGDDDAAIWIPRLS
jgi:predicted RNase H-like nuclease